MTVSHVAAFLVGGCTVGPNHVEPKIDSPASWSVVGEHAPAGLSSSPADVVQWWQLLGDSTLDSLIERAVESNHDLRIAHARLREARAARGIAAAALFPNVDVGGSYTRSRRSENVGFEGAPAGAGGGGAGGGSMFSAPGEETDLYQVGFDAGWELDFFGRVRRSVEAADANIGAAAANRRDVLVSLLGDVARHYTDLRGYQRRLDIARRNIDAQQQTVDLSNARFKAGLVSELDVAQAKAQLATTQSQVPALESAARQAIHALGLLVGRQPESLIQELTPHADIPSTPPQVPVGLPSDLLRRRPDIRAAERALAAATANIGVATADLFPRFTLTGSLGLAADDAAMVFNAGSRAFTFGPSVTWPIFDAGRIRANIAVHNARQEQALAAYEVTVLRSFRDVEDALIAYWKALERRVMLTQAVDANRRAVELSSELYSRGLGDFLRVLESQRALYAVEDQLVQSDRDVTANFIALYKALGGGWEAFEPPAATSRAAAENGREAEARGF
jgi:multidrug efflux system outer membrane protein